jgi:hypothetical protein
MVVAGTRCPTGLSRTERHKRTGYWRELDRACEVFYTRTEGDLVAIRYLLLFPHSHVGLGDKHVAGAVQRAPAAVRGGATSLAGVAAGTNSFAPVTPVTGPPICHVSNQRKSEQGPVVKHTEHNAVLPETGQSTGNDVEGDISGTSIQAGSIGELHLSDPRKPRRRRDFRYLVMPAATVVGALALVALVLMELSAPNEPVKQTPAAATTAEPVALPSSNPATSPLSPSAPATAGAARPVPPGKHPRLTPSSPAAVTPAPPATSTSAVTAPLPAPTGVRFNGTLQFGSFHLDLAQPRNIPGTNVWSMPQNRLHGDDGYELAEWIIDGVPGAAECTTDLAKRATRDAENLIIGSRVCGRTPGGRIFRIDVIALDSTITADVTVWD